MPRISTATLAEDGPSASSPADSVLACADTLRLTISAVADPNWARKASARSGTIIDVARSIAEFGSDGAKVAVASATSVAIRTTRAESASKARSGSVQLA